MKPGDSKEGALTQNVFKNKSNLRMAHSRCKHLLPKKPLNTATCNGRSGRLYVSRSIHGPAPSRKGDRHDDRIQHHHDDDLLFRRAPSCSHFAERIFWPYLLLRGCLRCPSSSKTMATGNHRRSPCRTPRIQLVRLRLNVRRRQSPAASGSKLPSGAQRCRS